MRAGRVGEAVQLRELRCPRRVPLHLSGRLDETGYKPLKGSFSAAPKRNFARKYAFDSIFQSLQDLHTFAPLQSQNFSKKSV